MRFLGYGLVAAAALWPFAADAATTIHQNSMRAPEQCRGYQSDNGSMAATSDILTDSTAHFASGDTPAQEKDYVSVNGAGSTWSAKSVSIVTPGKDYKALEAVTMADGTVVEVLVAGVIAHTAVLAASTANLDVTLAGTSVGATLTANANGAFTLDGQAGVLAGRYLIKDQTTTTQNGVFTLTTVGDAGTPYVLTRAWDFDQTSVKPLTKEVFPGAYFPVTNGTVNAGTNWMFNTLGTVTLGTTGLNFVSGTGGVPSLARIKTAVSTLTPSSGVGASPSSTSGVGTGLTVTITYQQDPARGQVKKVLSDTSLQLTVTNTSGADVSSATYGGSPNYDTAATDAMSRKYAGRAPSGLCGHLSTITVPSKSLFVGQGIGNDKDMQTTWMYLGPPNQQQLKVDNGSGSSSGIVMGDFTLDGMGVASIGMYLKGIAAPGCHILPIVVKRDRVLGVGVDSYGGESQYCTFEKLEVYQTATPSNYADCMYMGMDGNVNHHTVNKFNCQHSFGRGWIWGASDSGDIGADGSQGNQGGGTGMGTVWLGKAGDLNNRAVANKQKWGEDTAGAYAYGLESGFTLAAQNNNASINRVSGMDLPIVDDSASLVCDSFSVEGDLCGNPVKRAFSMKVTRDLTDYQITKADCGLVRTNGGAAQTDTWWLPPATGSGCRVYLRKQTNHKVFIAAYPGSTDVIKLGSGLNSAAGGSINTLATDPDNAEMVLLDSDVSTPGGSWTVETAQGIWHTDAGGNMQFGIPTNVNNGLKASIQIPVVAVASLPTCDATLEGALRAVNNSNTTTYNAAVAGGGANHITVYCNATAWVVQ